MAQNWITEKTASEMSAFSIQTLRNWRHLGRGPAYSKVGRSVRYRLEDVQKYLKQGRVDPEKKD
jgi:predicted site-specific integrase-resolvase